MTERDSLRAALNLVERALSSPGLRRLIPLLVLGVAVALGVWHGLPLGLLGLAAGVLLLVIALFWSSVQSLTGESPLTIDEALGLAAPSAEEERKRAVLRALKDLEYERSVGKLSEDDYYALVARYRGEAKRLLEVMEHDRSAARVRVEELVARRLVEEGIAEAPPPKPRKKKTRRERARRAEPALVAAQNGDAPPSSPATAPAREPELETELANDDLRRCANCLVRNDGDARFCKGCGQSLEAAS